MTLVDEDAPPLFNVHDQQAIDILNQRILPERSLLSDKSTYKWLAIDHLPTFRIELPLVLNGDCILSQKEK